MEVIVSNSMQLMVCRSFDQTNSFYICEGLVSAQLFIIRDYYYFMSVSLLSLYNSALGGSKDRQINLTQSILCGGDQGQGRIAARHQ